MIAPIVAVYIVGLVVWIGVWAGNLSYELDAWTRTNREDAKRYARALLVTPIWPPFALWIGIRVLVRIIRVAATGEVKK